MSADLTPAFGVVAIGRNEGERLKRCLEICLQRRASRLCQFRLDGRIAAMGKAGRRRGRRA